MFNKTIKEIVSAHTRETSHRDNDYFSGVSRLLALSPPEEDPLAEEQIKKGLQGLYDKIHDEILYNPGKPTSRISFGTSGWRGILGKDIFCRSVSGVTAAILSLYRDAADNLELREALGVKNFSEMQKRGCVVGFDNRFGGPDLALSAVNVLSANGVKVFYAGEATTGCLSASVLIHQAAFSINLTPSHNPLQYGGFKYNAADAGPAAPILTNGITERANTIIETNRTEFITDPDAPLQPLDQLDNIIHITALDDWKELVARNQTVHGLDYEKIINAFNQESDLCVVIDSVHGASRKDIPDFFNNHGEQRLTLLRGNADVTFGGIAPEPSSQNLQPVLSALAQRKESLKLGAIIDPDGDRIRFTDGTTEITMNQFGAMAYHFLHEIKEKKGMVAKTVATSNLANAVAQGLGEDIFEPKVGFKEFKPVLGNALVFFEESDGISIIGHTPEKDAYIGLLLALDMVLTTKKNLTEYLREIEAQYGAYFPDRDGVTVSQKGGELLDTLSRLDRYTEGSEVIINGKPKRIDSVITIDGRKMILEDGSWIMIRPSGTEPKVRFYVEARNQEETKQLVDTAKSMLAEIGLLS